MYKRFILTEEDKNEIVNLYSQKNIVLEQNAAEKLLTVADIQNKLVQLGYGDMLGKFGADGKFGTMTYSAITQAINDIELRKSSKSAQNTDAASTMKSKGAEPLKAAPSALPKSGTTPTLSQLTADITTKDQADLAITQAKMEAQKVKTQAKLDKQMCRTIGRAVSPLSPFKEGVASQDLCDALRRCVSEGFIARDESVFETCKAFPAKQVPPATGTQTTTV